MSAYNTEYAVLDQSPKPQEPLYHLLVQLLATPSFHSARELYWQLMSMQQDKFTVLTLEQVQLLDALSVLLQVLQHNRQLDTGSPLWLIPLRLTNALAEGCPTRKQEPVVYVLRRKVNNPMQYTVVATTSPVYTEQVFPSQAMAELALYRNQPFASVYDNYFYNTNYGAGAPKYHRRII